MVESITALDLAKVTKRQPHLPVMKVEIKNRSKIPLYRHILGKFSRFTKAWF